jgi:S1-C subfamily serine protease
MVSSKYCLQEATPARCFITDDGYLISNDHVVKGAAKVRLLTGAGKRPMKKAELRMKKQNGNQFAMALIHPSSFILLHFPVVAGGRGG